MCTFTYWPWFVESELTNFSPVLLFHKETSNLICTANQMTDFNMKCNTGLKWVKCVKVLIWWGPLTMRERCPDTEFLWSIFSCIFSCIQENTDQKKLRVWTLFTQWGLVEILVVFSSRIVDPSQLLLVFYFLKRLLREKNVHIMTFPSFMFNHVTYK